LEGAASGVRVNAVAPVETEMLNRFTGLDEVPVKNVRLARISPYARLYAR
jgi:NAD(P)-dependent dehydrogenase (short-subunit alcohol dehydrogenase family)